MNNEEFVWEEIHKNLYEMNEFVGELRHSFLSVGIFFQAVSLYFANFVGFLRQTTNLNKKLSEDTID
jgi:hypothetical protein